MVMFIYKKNIYVDAYRYSDVSIGAMAPQITSMTTVCPTFCSEAHERKHRSLALVAFVRGIHHSPVDSPHKGQ